MQAWLVKRDAGTVGKGGTCINRARSAVSAPRGAEREQGYKFCVRHRQWMAHLRKADASARCGNGVPAWW